MREVFFIAPEGGKMKRPHRFQKPVRSGGIDWYAVIIAGVIKLSTGVTAINNQFTSGNKFGFIRYQI